ncbi:MAG: hypothetical protein ACR2GH_18755 [Pseudonocardia sp.]
MTARDRLHALVDQLDDAAAEQLLATAVGMVPMPRSAPGQLPAFVGAFASGRTDVSERAEEILRDELGSTPDP